MSDKIHGAGTRRIMRSRRLRQEHGFKPNVSAFEGFAPQGGEFGIAAAQCIRPGGADLHGGGGMAHVAGGGEMFEEDRAVVRGPLVLATRANLQLAVLPAGDIAAMLPVLACHVPPPTKKGRCVPRHTGPDPVASFSRSRDRSCFVPAALGFVKNFVPKRFVIVDPDGFGMRCEGAVSVREVCLTDTDHSIIPLV